MSARKRRIARERRAERAARWQWGRGPERCFGCGHDLPMRSIDEVRAIANALARALSEGVDA